MKHLLTVRDADLDETVHQETIEGEDIDAERRLGDLWNELAAHLPDRGMVATAVREGETEPWVTIEG